MLLDNFVTFSVNLWNESKYGSFLENCIVHILDGCFNENLLTSHIHLFLTLSHLIFKILRVCRSIIYAFNNLHISIYGWGVTQPSIPDASVTHKGSFPVLYPTTKRYVLWFHMHILVFLLFKTYSINLFTKNKTCHHLTFHHI